MIRSPMEAHAQMRDRRSHFREVIIIGPAGGRTPVGPSIRCFFFFFFCFFFFVFIYFFFFFVCFSGGLESLRTVETHAPCPREVCVPNERGIVTDRLNCEWPRPRRGAVIPARRARMMIRSSLRAWNLPSFRGGRDRLYGSPGKPSCQVPEVSPWGERIDEIEAAREFPRPRTARAGDRASTSCP